MLIKKEEDSKKETGTVVSDADEEFADGGEES
jgi:hypothetical protein